MKVLVTGGSGVFGRTICRDLVRQGADVVAYARRPVDLPGVTSVSGDIRHSEMLSAAMAGCDRVVHLAFVLAPLRSSTGTEEINVGGTENVLQAMQDNDVSKLVFTSSTLAYGPWEDNPEVITEDQPLRPHPAVMYAKHKALCEQLIVESGIPAVITRTCVVAGRDMDNYEFRFLAHPALAAPRGPMKAWQFMHTDDVGRFHALATLNDRTGVVNVGPEDTGIGIEEIAEILGKPLVKLPFSVLKSVAGAAWRADALELSPADLDGFRYMPTLDTTRMVQDWGYQPVYGSREALADAVPGVKAVTYLGTSQLPTPWRTPAPDHRWTARPRTPGADLVDPAPAGEGGEFDDLIDPRYPTLTTANVGEAFVGTLTPMSLWVSRDAMRVAGAAQVELLGMTDPDLVAAQRTLAIASVGHRLYTNVSVVHAMATAMPGTSPREVDEHVLGIKHDEPEVEVTAAARGGWRQVRRLPGVGMRIAGVERRVAELERRVGQRATTTDELAALADGALLSLVDSRREQVIDTWTYSTTTNLVASAAQTLVRKVAPSLELSAMRGGTDGLASAALLDGVRSLAGRVRSDKELAAALSGDPAGAAGRLDDIDRRFATEFSALLERAGHRGPGETELANKMYADEPGRLLEAILRAASSPPRAAQAASPTSRAQRAALQALGRAVRRRERTKDVVIRATHGLRLALREVGRRQVAAGVFEFEDDIFYLIPEEVAAPQLHSHKIAGRRAERARLQHLQLPSLFTGTWEPAEAGQPDRSPAALSGLGVSAGVASGPVQILRDGDDDLEPGSVLVTHVTDVGWTALFDSAAAVVTDVGGLHSHAAVVAREFGIPCVVATESATRAFKNGQMVRVDGDAGTVTPL